MSISPRISILLLLFSSSVFLALEFPPLEDQRQFKLKEKGEQLAKFLHLGHKDSSSSSSEEDFSLDKFNLHGILDFFHHFKGSKRCGRLGKHILRDTERLFHHSHAAAGKSRCHHLSHLFSRYAEDCCDY